MTRRLTIKGRLYLALALLAGVGGLAGRPELVALGTPFSVVVAVGLAHARWPSIGGGVELAAERVFEDTRVAFTASLRASPEVTRLACAVQIGGPVRVAWGHPHWDGRRHFVVAGSVRPVRWGAVRVGPVGWRARDALGVVEHVGACEVHRDLVALPRPEPLRAITEPAHARLAFGDHRSRDRGDGVEFAEVRPLQPGDRPRSLNARVTARRGQPFVTTRHPERNADVVLLLDTFAELRTREGATLDRALRAAAGLARAHLRRRDRVGVVGFGGILQWLEPGLGSRHEALLADALVRTEIAFSYVAHDVRFVPRRLLPPRAIVLALTPLLDDRFVSALADLARRGRDLAIFEISPAELLPPAATTPDVLARRLWGLERDALRAQFRQLGVPVVVWRLHQPLQRAVEEVITSRRRPYPNAA